MNTTTLPATDVSSPTIERMEHQIGWYAKTSAQNRRWYMRLKIATLISASAIPLASGIGSLPWVAGGLGVLVVVFEGIQQLNQFHHHWVSYRGTCEALRHEKFLYLALAGPYATAENPLRLLAERVEELVSTEHAKWVSQREQAEKPREAV